MVAWRSIRWLFWYIRLPMYLGVGVGAVMILAVLMCFTMMGVTCVAVGCCLHACLTSFPKSQ